MGAGTTEPAAQTDECVGKEEKGKPVSTATACRLEEQPEKLPGSSEMAQSVSSFL